MAKLNVRLEEKEAKKKLFQRLKWQSDMFEQQDSFIFEYE